MAALSGKRSPASAGLPCVSEGALGGFFFGIELGIGGFVRTGLFSPVQLEDRSHAHFPDALLLSGLLVGAFAASQFSLNRQMRALLERLCIFGKAAPDDAAMPLGMVDVFAGRLVLVRALGGERQSGEIGVVGGYGGGVVAEKSDERNAILIHGEVSV